MAPGAEGVVGARDHLPLRRLGDECVRAHPLRHRRAGADHPGLRPGRLGARLRIPREPAGAGARRRGGGARQHRTSHPASAGGGVEPSRAAHRVRTLRRRALAEDLRRSPGRARGADRGQRETVDRLARALSALVLWLAAAGPAEAAAIIERLTPTEPLLKNPYFDVLIVSIREIGPAHATHRDPPRGHITVEGVLRGRVAPGAHAALWEAPMRG